MVMENGFRNTKTPETDVKPQNPNSSTRNRLASNSLRICSSQAIVLWRMSMRLRLRIKGLGCNG